MSAERPRSWMRAGDGIWVIPYDPAWPDLFAAAARPLRAALGSIAVRIDHVGSTAVPGTTAKPVIDIQISVATIEPVAAIGAALARCGYVFRADNPDRTQRYFRETPGARRTHIHVRRAGSFAEQFALLFRDYLRAHAGVAADYGALKGALAERHPAVQDRPLYTEAKRPFVWKVMALADAWSQETGWEAGPPDA